MLFLCAASLYAADIHQPETTIVRGKLTVAPGKPPVLETAEHKPIALEGDDTYGKVLADPRLNGFEIEVHGRFTSPDHFVLNPSHTHSMLVRKDGKLKLVSYWCDICSIRAYTPGPCVCCQRETELELREPDQH
jgi:hypothetical protein